MTERLLLTFLLMLIGCGAYVAFRQVQLWRLNGKTAARGRRSVTLRLLYFRSDTCAACPTQARFVEKVAEKWNGRLAVQTIDVNAQPTLAKQYYVMTLPTTLLIDTSGTVRNINFGVTNTQKLNQQVENLLT